MTDQPRRPWWKWKRWVAALLLWLVVAYPLSTGPVIYGAHRGWVPVDLYYAYCWLPSRALYNRFGVAIGYWDYVIWCQDLGISGRLAASD